jgi:hypothetical protein
MTEDICPYFKVHYEDQGLCGICDNICEAKKAKYHFRYCWRYDRPNIAKAVFELCKVLAQESLRREKIKRKFKEFFLNRFSGLLKNETI